MSKSFIDLLFILLCGTIVMLSQSLQVGAIEAAPAKVGSGGVSEILADQVTLVAVDQNALRVSDPATGQTITATAAEIDALLPEVNCILLSAGQEDVTHASVMAAWSQFRQLGRTVKLAASTERPQSGV